MPPALRLCCCTLIVALLSAGCSFFEETSTDPPVPAGPATTTTTPNPEIIDVGQEPRRLLRLDLVEDTESTVVLELTAQVSRGEGADQLTIAPPTASQTVSLTVGEVEGDRAAVSFAVTAVDLDRDSTSDSISDEDYLRLLVDLRAIVGLEGSGSLDDRGRFSEMSYDVPDAIAPKTAAAIERVGAQLDELTIALPEQRLGEGASWRTRSTRQVSGFTYQQVSTFQITELTDATITYSVASSLHAADQAMDPASLPDETSGRLVSADLTGTATGTLDLRSVLGPFQSTLTGIQEIEIATDGAPPVTSSQAVDVSVSVAATG